MKDKLYNLFSFINEYALYGVLFFIPISISLIEIFVVFMSIGFIGRKLIKPDFKFLRSWPNAFLLLFVFFNAVSILNSGTYINISLNALFGKWMQYAGICIIAQDIIHDSRVFKRGMFVFLFAAALVVLSGLSQYFFGIEFLRNKSMIAMSGGGMPAMTSSFVHYNSFGGYLVVVLSLAIAILLAIGSFDLKAFSLLVFSMFSTAAIILTFSRGSWLAMAFSFVFIFSFFRKNFRRLMPVFIVIIAMCLFFGFHERLFLALKPGGDSDRFKYWTTAFKMILSHPFLGVGVGTFMANFQKYAPLPAVREAYAHNCYLQIWAETGFFSLASFMAFVGSLFILGIKKILNSKDFLLLGLLSGAAGFLIHSFFEVNLYSLQLAVLFWLWAGLIIAKARHNA